MEMRYKCLYTEEKKKEVQFKKCDCLLDYVHLTKRMQVHYRITSMALYCTVSITAARK